MNIRKILINLFSFATYLRQAGTTSLIKKIASENDVWVLAPNQQAKKIFGKSGITLDELNGMKGYKSKPILVDNYTLLKLTELSLEEFERLDLSIEKRNRLIKIIGDEIRLFERENDNDSLKNEI